ncbi:hypothetical protein AGR1A_Cc50410 [Agrobacterium fabacearum CFBP 5771]|nr:hypothetical protein AGR1B_Cc10192 [Agrobacterium fabacearum S56]CVI18541.1 hypothetical protein AGR1A_Cc50410 [Agrobacterium fabacearum CFBP 5771]
MRVGDPFDELQHSAIYKNVYQPSRLCGLICIATTIRVPANKTAEFDLVKKHEAKVLKIRVEGRLNREDREGSIVIPCFTFVAA